MLVETYEMTEMDCDGEVELESEAIELIEKLDLDGQRELIRTSDDGGAQRCPYRKMTADENFVYNQICPQHQKLKEYNSGPIPVRILQVAAHAVEIFDYVEVWSVTDSDLKDPVLLGRMGSEYSGDLYMLARWGEELLPFSELRRIAAEKFKAKYSAACRDIMSTAQVALNCIADLSDEECIGKSEPSSYGW